MTIELVACPYGTPARRALAEAVRRTRTTDPLAPVTVIVTTNAVGVASRRYLARSLGGIAGVDFATAFRVAERLGAGPLAADARRPVSTPLLAAALRRVLRAEPRVFVDVAEHPATERALVRVHRELGELDDAELRTLADQSERAAAVVAIHRAVREHLRPEWHDEHDLVAAAIDAARSDADLAERLGPVLWYLPQRLSVGHARLARSIATRTRTVVIAGMTGESDADDEVRTGLDRLGVAGATATSGTPRPGAPPMRLISVTDPDDEVRAAIRTVVARIDDGVPLGRMAILAPREVPYERIIHDQLVAAGIPFHAARGRALGECLLARRLRALLALRDRDYARAEVLGLLVDDPGGRGAEWEVQSRAAGIVGGVDDWTVRLPAFVAARRAESSRPERFDPGRRQRAIEAADDAQALHDRVVTIIDDLERAARSTSWSALAAMCGEMVEHHLAPAHTRSAWPDREVTAADRVDAAVRRLGALEAVDDRASFTAFRRVLEIELADGRVREGRAGDGLLFGPLSAALGVELDHVVIVGMAEGVVPGAPTEDAVIPDRERDSVAGALSRRVDAMHEQRRQFLIALAEAAEVTLIRPRSDLRRTLELPPSRWLPEVPDPTVIPSFVAGIADADPPATGQDWTLGRLLDLGTAPASAWHTDRSALTGVLADRPLALGAAMVAERRSGRFGRFDGNLSHLDRADPLDHAWSATRLEAWAACPHGFLMEHVLGVDAVEDPETAEELSPARRGSLVHEVLDRFVRERLDREEGQPWPPEAAPALGALADEAFAVEERAGGTGRPIAWHRLRARVHRELEAFLVHDSERLVSGRLRPVATELRFGFPDSDEPPLDVPLGGGRILRLTGSIDRVDQAADGRLVVTDYKTGSAARYTGLSESDPHGGGRHLQLAVYGMAARRWAGTQAPVEVGYWFISERGGFRRIGYDLTDRVLTASVRAIEEIVAGIDRGHFPARPEEPKSFQLFTPCRFCDPDDLGTKDGYQRWRTLRRDPTLGSYVALVEPEAVGE